ncbi:pyruvyl transferase 1 [Plakobranchus ocellatus]|uniref:Pyruvyl transferase 1 n=1 Tax=Plakobranchus ocellatus TaxID=259542 RepID=A0AAV4CUR8_9GAST|nr:pyruvyl transferase 1 [Plakobranchus ocellatus]
MSSYLSSKLRTREELVKESQRLHFDIIGKALQQYKYAMLLDIAAFENKGDPCITVGEIYFLARIKLKIIFYCAEHKCNNNTLYKAVSRAQQYSPNDLVILLQGGGNIVGYQFVDESRFNIIKAFKNFQKFVFPQSISIRDLESPHLKECVKMYCCNENLTFVMRDHLSYSLAKKHFQGGATKFVLAPDIAFQIGPVPRFMSPVFDIMWIRRTDKETPGYSKIPAPPPGIRLHVSDWWKWITPEAPSSLEKAFYICTNGFFYLQRGRVLITDRLHGHIFATLMNIPHVLIDNKAHKLSSYHRSWIATLENTLITDDPAKALDLAMELLVKYNSSLPPRVPFLHLGESLREDNTFALPDMSFI